MANDVYLRAKVDSGANDVRLRPDGPDSGGTAYADTLSAGAYFISGKNITDIAARVDLPSAGAYLVSGGSIIDRVARLDSASTGAYLISGKSITDIVVRVDSLSSGAYSISGKSISDVVARADNFAAGAYSIVGKDITDAVVSGGVTYADNLSSGAYLIVGNDITDQHFTPSHGWVDRSDIVKKKKKKKHDTLRETLEAHLADKKEELEQARVAIQKIAYPDAGKLELLSKQVQKLSEKVENAIIREDEDVLLLLIG